MGRLIILLRHQFWSFRGPVGLELVKRSSTPSSRRRACPIPRNFSRDQKCMEESVVADNGGRASRVENDAEGLLWLAVGCDPERRRWLGVFRRVAAKVSAYQQMVAARAPHELALHNYVKISNWCPSLSVKTICLNRAGKALLRWTRTINSGSLRIGAINWTNVPEGLWIVHS